MSYAPDTLRELGAFWSRQGGVNLGIVGDEAHQARASYHNGQDAIDRYGRTATNDYTIRLARDREPYLTNAASALDLGRLDGSLPALQKFSVWLVAECKASAPGTRDIREVIYSPDGKVVKRWDNHDKVLRSGYPVATGQGDSSHLWHTHISFFRDSEARDKVGIFAPYFGLESVHMILFETPRKARLTADAVLYDNPALADSPGNLVKLDQKEPDGSIRWFLYPGYISNDVRVLGYEPVGGDVETKSPAMYVRAAHIAGSTTLYSTTPTPEPVDCTDQVETARREAAAAATTAERSRAQAIRDAAVALLGDI
jgi:hypothetical protein